MGIDYALVHLKFNIPPAIILTFLYRPLLTKLDIYRILFLICIAVTYTIPWDSYLIRTRIWTYPRHVIFGPTLFDIPLEEVFFFVIQTYNTSLLYLLLSKATFHPIYLRHEQKSDKWRYIKLVGQLVIAFVFKKGLNLIRQGEHGLYLGLIIVWALPVFALLWSLAYQMILGLHFTNTVLPIVLPTLFLWVVDTLALRRGTWVIETGTKYGVQVWPHLEIEEAIFFLFTNSLIVLGLVAFDNAVAILDAFPLHFPQVPALPSPLLLIKALLLPAAAYDQDRLNGLAEATGRLSRKSRSFYLASGVFQGRLRVDLILLYSFCRVADDLVDNAKSPTEAKQWIKKMRSFLDLSYNSKDPAAWDPNTGIITRYVVQTFPRDCHSAFLQLQTRHLSSKPLYDLLKGFDMDLDFERTKKSHDSTDVSYPVKNETDLDVYSQYVAGTVAQLCIELCLFHHPDKHATLRRDRLLLAGQQMGMALQYTNIARDVEVDAAMDRIYIPTSWLKKEKLSPAEAIRQLKRGGVSPAADGDSFFGDKIKRLRGRLLDQAFALYEESRSAIEELPLEVRGSMRVAVESYMEIARTLRQEGYTVRKGRATVPKWRRLLVAWKALNR